MKPAPLPWLFPFAAALLFSFCARHASADETPVSRMRIGEDLRGYYVSERTVAFSFVGLGALSLVAGGVLVTRSGDFSRGLGWSLLSLGALEAVGAGFYAFAVNDKMATYSAELARDPDAFKRDEAAHIQGTTSRFVFYRLTELAVFLGGAAVAGYGFATKREAWQGAGVGIVAHAAILIAVDTYTQSRAAQYEDHLRRLDPQVAVDVGGGGRPWSVGMSGRF